MKSSKGQPSHDAAHFSRIFGAIGEDEPVPNDRNRTASGDRAANRTDKTNSAKCAVVKS